jgi:hypothetical protein
MSPPTARFIIRGSGFQSFWISRWMPGTAGASLRIALKLFQLALDRFALFFRQALIILEAITAVAQWRKYQPTCVRNKEKFRSGLSAGARQGFFWRSLAPGRP